MGMLWTEYVKRADAVRRAPAFAVACTVVNLGHLASIVANEIDGSWDGGGRKHDGFDTLVPWLYVSRFWRSVRRAEVPPRIGFLGM
jgi:hypothetical protein